MPFLSFTMIVKNEARCIVRCLESVAPLVDEFVIVDTGSRDDTISLIEEVHASHPDKLFQILPFEWNDDFAAARNFGIDHCSGKYIFTLDADEYIDSNDLQKFKQAKQFLKHNREHYLVGFQLINVGASDMAVQISEKVFPNHPNIRYRRRIHELIHIEQVPVKKYRVDVKILHDGYTAEVNQLEKKARNLRILNEMIQANPNDNLSLVYFARDLFYVNPGQSVELLKRVSSVIPENEAYLREICAYYLDVYTKSLEARNVQ